MNAAIVHGTAPPYFSNKGVTAFFFFFPDNVVSERIKALHADNAVLSYIDRCHKEIAHRS